MRLIDIFFRSVVDIDDDGRENPASMLTGVDEDGLWRSREIKTDDSRLPSATTAGKRLDDIVDVGWV